MPLNDDHIGYIIKDLHYRGLVLEGLSDELIDHVCTATEAKMDSGKNFIKAYNEVLQSFGSNKGLLKTQKQTLRSETKTTRIMIRNYFIIAWRNLKKHQFYTFINVAGLATGVAACLIIVVFVLHELGYDRHHGNASRIYRVNGEIKFGDNHWKLAVAPAPLAEALVQDYPEIQDVVRFRGKGSYLVRRTETDVNIKEERVIWVDNAIFKIFTVPVIEGNAATALSEPNSIAISKKTAVKYFPGRNAIGQTLIFNNDQVMKVTTVFEDMNPAGHFNFDILISMTGLDEARSHDFLSNNFNTYILLKDRADAKALEAKLPALVEKHIGPQAAAVLGGEFTMEAFRASGNKIEYTLMPLADIYLHSDLTAELGVNGDITYVYLFSAIALFILVIACINFMNLATARSSNRAKEVGVRKVMGSLRSHLVRQFLTESVLLSLFSFGLALAAAYLLLPMFNSLAQKNLVLPVSSPFFYLAILAAAIFTGFLAGIYPSLFLSAFKPVQVLKGNVARGMKSGVIRSSLVVFQFVISIFLIIATIAIDRQMAYIQGKKIGFEKNQVLVVKNTNVLNSRARVFKEQVLKNNFIISGTVSSYLPVTNSSRNDNTFWPAGAQPTQENMVGMQCWSVDHDYLKTLSMSIKSGRFFSQEFPSDSTAIVLNEAAVAHFGFGNDVIGKKVSTFSGNRSDGTPDTDKVAIYTIVGIVENFHFESLKQNIGPLAFFLRPSNGRVSFRFEAKNAQNVIEAVEKTWKSLAPELPFQYSFLDEDFDRMYSNESRLGKIFGVFSALAIIIACLGLFALTAFTAEQRTKEIGIRKVLGASVGSIIVLLSKEFGKLVLIAFILSAPLAWYAIDWWLDNYTYKTTVGVFVFAGAGLFAFLIAWLTMGYQSVRAATANPVKALRSE